MNCPKCQAPMETVSFEGVEVNRCTGCRGLFFEARKAQQMKALRGSEVIDVGDPVEGRKQNSNDRIRCPVDTTPLVRMVDPKQSHIYLESCPVCQGMFFDAGEFADWKKETLLDLVRSWFAPARD